MDLSSFSFEDAAKVLLLALGLGFVLLVFLSAPGRRLRRRWKADRLREKVLALQANAPTAEAVLARIADELVALAIAPDSLLGQRVSDLARTLYPAEVVAAPPETPSSAASELDLALYCDQMRILARHLADPTRCDTFVASLVALADKLKRRLPKAFAEADEPSGAVAPSLTVPLLDLASAPALLVEELITGVSGRKPLEAGLFKRLRETFETNAWRMSDLPPEGDPRKRVLPTRHKGEPDAVARGYLAGTPFLPLLFDPVPFVLPLATRFEHQWLVAGTGHGKTQTIQCEVASDLERVVRGEASVIVIDGQGELIDNIAHLKMFAPGGALEGRLVLLDPTDIAFPIALNLFDVGLDRIKTYGALDRERMLNGVLELFDYVFTSLLSAELTQKQGVVFRFITRLLVEIPDATIHTFRELMEPKGYAQYQRYIDRLDGTARAFFETEFNSRQFDDTKRQVLRRLWGVLENRTFERMFSHPRNRFNMFEEMNAGRVILIHTAGELLKKNGMETLGRFFIALIAQAAQERAAMPKDKRTPVLVYIDECADYLDGNVAMILEKMRKFNVGLVLAHQHTGQLTPKLFDSFAADTSIKFAGGTSDKDSRALAHMMRCTPEFIDAQPKAHFAAFVRNLTPRAVSLEIPLGLMEAMPRMSAAEFAKVRDNMRARYAVPWQTMAVTPPVQDDGSDPSAPASTW